MKAKKAKRDCVTPLKHLLIVLGCAIVSAGCGSDYDHGKWPESPYPDYQELSKLKGIDRLKFFRERSPGVEGVPGKVEMWADEKFDFNACLYYYYTFERNETDKCVKGATFQVHYPVTTDWERTFLDLLALFEKNLRADLSPIRKVFPQYAKEAGSRSPFTQTIGNHVVEIGVAHQVTRGDFLVLGVYDKAYYDRSLVPH